VVTVTSPVDDDARPSVLIAEDAVLMRMELADMLEGSGFRALPVASAEEALKVLTADSNIQAVVTDVNLSPEGADGFALARQVHSERNIGVVVISGQVIPDAELPPGEHFLAKPVHEATLVHLVRSVMPAHAQEVSSRLAGATPLRQSTRAEGEGALTLTPRHASRRFSSC
jgi:CheY-like chemotaxis protein